MMERKVITEVYKSVVYGKGVVTQEIATNRHRESKAIGYQMVNDFVAPNNDSLLTKSLIIDKSCA